LNIAQQKYAHAKADYEASLKRGGGMDGKELRHREQALQMYKQLYEKAQKYAESAKKMYQNIHGETDRVIWMTNRQRDKLEKSKEEGDNFLKKAIAALNEYTE
jgi:tetrahydrodipicolinate N-succinyltransferase